MKKVVVVVDGKVETYKEMFEGENLDAVTLGISEGNYQRLEIMDGVKMLGQFSEWTYWRQIE